MKKTAQEIELAGLEYQTKLGNLEVSVNINISFETILDQSRR
jgi:hypothetical protein